MDGLEFFLPIGFLGISYLYWAILTFLIALLSLFIRIPPFALPKNPSNWIVKKIILQYFHISAWLIISWVFYRLYKREGELTFWLGVLTGIAGVLLTTFLMVWMIDRYTIRKMKDINRKSNQ
ncbi:MAG TPA: hypothetical protein VKZ54_07075 [Membranihabitans sp.]|nr:hypothetical protein [Membranihabitans sp.]